MSSAVNFKAEFTGWHPRFSAMGCFCVRWVFVRDVHYRQVQNVSSTLNRPVQYAEDGEELDFHNGLKLVKSFQNKATKSLLEDFAYYNDKEQLIQTISLSKETNNAV